MESPRDLALVAGASSGLGEALAVRLAKDSRDVVIVALRRERLEALAARLQAETGASVDVLVAGLTCPGDLLLVEERIVREGRLDLLVTNAGFAGYGALVEIEPRVAGVPLLTAGDVAQAIVAGLGLGETLCAPTLEDATQLRDCANCSRRP